MKTTTYVSKKNQRAITVLTEVDDRLEVEYLDNHEHQNMSKSTLKRWFTKVDTITVEKGEDNMAANLRNRVAPKATEEPKVTATASSQQVAPKVTAKKPVKTEEEKAAERAAKDTERAVAKAAADAAKADAKLKAAEEKAALKAGAEAERAAKKAAREAEKANKPHGELKQRTTNLESVHQLMVAIAEVATEGHVVTFEDRFVLVNGVKVALLFEDELGIRVKLAESIEGLVFVTKGYNHAFKAKFQIPEDPAAKIALLSKIINQ